uniref:Uncharacterized protein n=1 Tax=Rhizochromulina marina TaxID=1034831 RepID=A0A7S2SVV7_9STRA|mmetsp:Transcript_884/g.2869  ORF Transcript_884/g.2869 Transcript_884/m.2869 type:complete len:321 (+) Transcript_884:75-1037(+)
MLRTAEDAGLASSSRDQQRLRHTEGDKTSMQNLGTSLKPLSPLTLPEPPSKGTPPKEPTWEVEPLVEAREVNAGNQAGRESLIASPLDQGVGCNALRRPPSDQGYVGGSVGTVPRPVRVTRPIRRRSARSASCFNVVLVLASVSMLAFFTFIYIPSPDMDVHRSGGKPGAVGCTTLKCLPLEQVVAKLWDRKLWVHLCGQFSVLLSRMDTVLALWAENLVEWCKHHNHCSDSFSLPIPANCTSLALGILYLLLSPRIYRATLYNLSFWRWCMRVAVSLIPTVVLVGLVMKAATAASLLSQAQTPQPQGQPEGSDGGAAEW